MSKRNMIERAPITAWQAESLRVTVFPTPASPAGDHGWWRDLVGEPPTRTVAEPRQNIIREEGPFDGGTLVSEILPIRIDWRLMATEQRAIDLAFPSIGTFTESVVPFVELMLRWLHFESCPAVQRLAFGAILYLPVDDMVSGYRQISAYLPSIELDVEHSSDFHYQINRPRQSVSGVPDLRLNRLTKWSVGRFQMVEFALTGVRGYGNVVSDRFACRLELDLNTAPERQEALPQDEVDALLEELICLAKEIVERGDIP